MRFLSIILIAISLPAHTEVYPKNTSPEDISLFLESPAKGGTDFLITAKDDVEKFISKMEKHRRFGEKTYIPKKLYCTLHFLVLWI